MIKAGDLIKITTNNNGKKHLELNREVFDSMDKHQKETFTRKYSEWFLSAREEYAENIGEDYEGYIISYVEEAFDNDEDFQEAYNTEHTREEFKKYYEDGDFDKIPELKEMEKRYDEEYLEEIIDMDFEYAPFLIATSYYGHAEQFIDVVREGLSSLWETGAPDYALDKDYMFLTEEEELLMTVTDENVEEYEEEWLMFAEKLIEKFPNVDIAKVYRWIVENDVPFWNLEEVTIGHKWLSYGEKNKYSLVA